MHERPGACAVTVGGDFAQSADAVVRDVPNGDVDGGGCFPPQPPTHVWVVGTAKAEVQPTGKVLFVGFAIRTAAANVSALGSFLLYVRGSRCPSSKAAL